MEKIAILNIFIVEKMGKILFPLQNLFFQSSEWLSIFSSQAPIANGFIMSSIMRSVTYSLFWVSVDLHNTYITWFA